MGPRPHAVADNRERAAKSGEAVAPFLTRAREAILALGHLLAKPEALAGVAVVKLDRHFYFSIRRPEPVRFPVLCGRRRDQSECRGAAKNRLRFRSITGPASCGRHLLDESKATSVRCDSG